MSIYLVTGGAGFVGSHIAAALVARGDSVRILDNFSTGSRDNLLEIPHAEVIEGDIRSYHVVRDAVDGAEFVLHQAALPSVPRSVNDPITSNEVNVVGTLNILNAARDARVARLVYASSSSIYGRSPLLPKSEDMSPSPISPYAVSKLAGEHYCRSFFEMYGFETVMLRYFNVFGPRQSPFSAYAAVIPRFIHQLLHGQSPTVNGDGTQTRDFTFVDNVVSANLSACHAAGIGGTVLNVAAGNPYSLVALLDELSEIIGCQIEPTFRPSQIGDVPHSHADIKRANALLGYVPEVGLREGLERTVESMREEQG